MTVETSVFDPNALHILKERYFYQYDDHQETEEEFFDRVSLGNPEYRKMLSNLDFLPNSPTLFNVGIPGAGTLSACFKFDIQDTMEGKDGARDGIVDAGVKALRVLKHGGGVGFALHVRPEGAHISTTHGKAMGPVGVMEWLHGGAKMITQGGKREAAQMAILRCDHEDIRKFIHCKDVGGDYLSTFNISVAITDDFMERAKHFPDGEESQLLQEMAESAWKTGDPGVYFIDRAERSNPTPWLGKLTGTNPCVRGNTLVLTRLGHRRIDSLVGQSIQVWNGEEWSVVVPQVTGLNKRLVRVTLDNGMRLDCTPNHVFYRKDGRVVEAKELRQGDVLERLASEPVDGNYSHIQPYTSAYLAGFFAGDGFGKGIPTTGANSGWINFYHEKKIKIGRELEKRGLVKLQPYSEIQNRQRGRVLVEVSKRHVPLDNEPRDQIEWLAGLLDADGGTVFNGPEKRNYGYQICSISKPFLRKTALLLRGLGVSSVMALMKENPNHPWNGIYDLKKCYRLTISSVGATRLVQLGLPVQRLHHGVNTPQRNAGRYPRVVSVKDHGIARKVYCFKEPLRGRGVFNGILTGQCGEVQLLDNEACNLGSINYGHFIDSMGINWERLEYTVRLATRYLDDILDLNVFPDELITNIVMKTRKLGLGVAGWADALALMNVHYASDRAVELSAEVSSRVNNMAYDESIKMAKEKGPAPAWAESPVSGTAILPRNTTRTCIAPTGTISILMGASSGIEPHFSREWQRRLGDGTILHEQIPVIERLPEGFIPQTAMEIPWEWHVKHQAAWQRNIDLAVSKTINMAEDATVEDIRAAYEMMWKSNCVGGTIYRDKSRDVQVLTTGDNGVTTEVIADGPVSSHVRTKLPDMRRGPIRKVRVGETKFYMIVGEYPDGSAGEVFLNMTRRGSTEDALFDAVAMLMSFHLQSGGTVRELVNKFSNTRFEPAGLTSDKDIPMATSVLDYVVRRLDMDYGDGEPTVLTSLGQRCPDCGSDTKYEEGCMSCVSPLCDWSRC